MFDKTIEKIIDRSLYGSKKDRRIRELWDALNHACSIIETYGRMQNYEANLKWEPPTWLRDGEYTMDKRLEDIRYHSEKLTECAEEIRKVLFKDCDIGPKF